MESSVMKFLDHLGEKHPEKALLLCDKAANEISFIENKYSTEFRRSQKETVQEVKLILTNLKGNQTRSACVAALSTSSRYNQHIVGCFLQERNKEKPMLASSLQSRTSIQERDQYGLHKTYHGSTETGNKSDTSKYDHGGSVINNVPRSSLKKEEFQMNKNYASTQYHRFSQREQTKRGPTESMKWENSTRVDIGSDKPGDLTDEEYRRDQKSKRASQAMRHNNPDIADLSDVNRPTKLAEKFSELYDNEWTEAFEVLSKKYPEKEVIALLLDIVKAAYTFCQKEASKRFSKIQTTYNEGNHVTGSEYREHQYDAGKENFVDYRKSIADKEVKRLQDDFYHDLLNKSKLPRNPIREAETAKYAERAVELSWWMNVQDPPVYMCPTTQPFDQNLFRAYTKSGNIPDFFVWPALRLYEKGGLLAKGVVQYKS